jgi:hypothetical protein
MEQSQRINLQNAEWFEHVVMATQEGVFMHGNLPGSLLRLLYALRRLVLDGCVLTNDLFLEVLSDSSVLPREDHNNSEVQRVLSVVREEAPSLTLDDRTMHNWYTHTPYNIHHTLIHHAHSCTHTLMHSCTHALIHSCTHTLGTLTASASTSPRLHLYASVQSRRWQRR